MKALVIGALVALASPASGDSLQARKAAEKLEAEAHDDPAKAEPCEQAWLAVHAAEPKGSQTGAKALLGAANCAMYRRDAKATLRHVEKLAAYPARFREVADGHALAADTYAALGQHDLAAKRFELAAAGSLGDIKAGHDRTVAWAINAWVTHGNDALIVAAAERLFEAYGAYGTVPLVLAEASAAAYARAGKKLPAAMLAKLAPDGAASYAHFEDWRKSCGAPRPDGLCVKLDRDVYSPIAAAPPPIRPRCTATTRVAFVPVKRDARRAASALAALEALVAYADRDPSRAKGRNALAARLALADSKLEAYFAIRFPAGLDFDPNNRERTKASTQRFGEYIAAKTKLGTEIRERYEKIMQLAKSWDAAMEIAAMSRMGLALESFAVDLGTAEIPRDVRTGEFAADKVDAFCDQLEQNAQPLVTQAKQAFEACLQKASAAVVHDAATRDCERELAHLDPKAAMANIEMQPAMPFVVPFALEPPSHPRKDLPAELQAAVKAFQSADLSGGWVATACKSTASTFATIAAKPDAPVEAHYMAGLAYQRCRLHADAERSYTAALQRDPKHRGALNNRAAAWARLGKVDAAREAWTALDAKANLAALHLLKADPVARPEITKAALAEASKLLAAVFAADPRSDAGRLVRVAFELLSPAPRFANAERDLALVPRDAYRLETTLFSSAIAARRDGWTAFGSSVGYIVTMVPDSEEVQLARAITLARIGRYNDASERLAAVKTSTYDAELARGIVLRGQGKITEAQSAYGRAIAISEARPEAHYNLGVLLKDHVAARATDPAIARTALTTAGQLFRKAATRAPKSDAARLAAECEKLVAKK